ncbi:MAG TPA: SAF domain-containing protein [Jatrophihabitantaceae bacterium]|jgi:hypothetical protein
MTTPLSPSPRRVRTPNWLDLRLVAGVFLVLVAVAVGGLVVANAGKTRRVWAVTHDVAAGTTLTTADVAPARIRMTHAATLYIPADSDPGHVVGQKVNRNLTSGELLPRSALTSTDATVTMTVPLSSDQAPKITRGQKITLWVSTKSSRCQAQVVVGAALVQEVESAGGGSFGTSSAENIVVRLSPADARQVVAVLDLDDAVVRAGALSNPDQAPPADHLDGCGVGS